MPEERHHDHDYELIRKLNPGKVILPVLIGVVVVVWLIAKEMSINTIREITFTWSSVFWLFVAFLFVVLRTYGYMSRIRTLCDNELTWLQSFRVIMLWEFTSAITPSTVGGTAFAVIFLHKEGISVGRSTSIVLLTSFLDELYFAVMFPVVIILSGWSAIFITSGGGTGNGIMNNLVIVALAGYLIILAWVIIIGYGLFFKPNEIKKIIIRIFSLPLLRRWKNQSIKAGDEIITSSEEFKRKTSAYWQRVLISTFLTWTARYLVVNAILMAFFEVADHLLIFSRQLVLWVIMLLGPTPGGSGFAEIILSTYISDLIPVDPLHADGVSLTMAVLWRTITYYPFLLAGVLILPGWIERKFKRNIKK